MREMKLYIIIFMSLLTLGAYAQNTSGTDLNITLNPIQSIRINEAQNDVSIALNTASEYIHGKATQQANHLEIMSSTNYEIKVSAATHLTGTTDVIDVNTVTITPTLGTTGGPATGTINLLPAVLSLGENTIVQASHGDIQRSFNIQYRVSGGEAYLNKPLGTYTTIVTYTILMP